MCVELRPCQIRLIVDPDANIYTIEINEENKPENYFGLFGQSPNL